MSQHNFLTQHNGMEVVVQLGFDRPLGHLFMVIAQASGHNDPIYSNQFQPDAFDLTLTDYRSVLGEMGISVPESMFEQVELDQALGVGNRVAWHSADGRFTDRFPAPAGYTKAANSD